MLKPLNGEYNKHRQNRQGGRPYSEIAKPDAGVVDDLDGKLNGNVGDDDGEENLEPRVSQLRQFAPLAIESQNCHTCLM